MNGIERIAKERQRQVSVEGWTPQHDDEHKDGEMAIAAACYAAPYSIKADICRNCPMFLQRGYLRTFGRRYRETWLARPVALEWGVGQARKARTNSATRNRRSTSRSGN